MKNRYNTAIFAALHSGGISFVLTFFFGAFIMHPVLSDGISLFYGLWLGILMLIIVATINFLLWFC